MFEEFEGIKIEFELFWDLVDVFFFDELLSFLRILLNSFSSLIKVQVFLRIFLILSIKF